MLLAACSFCSIFLVVAFTLCSPKPYHSPLLFFFFLASPHINSPLFLLFLYCYYCCTISSPEIKPT
ncbi:hypothetical protein CPB86DRAFT_319997 [Serendipita vermifera]|nr:hypothetical protein CPB86DRAFT_319997 [Serendipita vermifera]